MVVNMEALYYNALHLYQKDRKLLYATRRVSCSNGSQATFDSSNKKS